MKKKMLFVFNPHSGKGKIKIYLLDIIDLFTKADYVVTVHPTQNPGDCADELCELDRSYDLVVVSGGDGTLKEAVTGMLRLPYEKRIPIGYIPAGTMNDFASGNGIPKTMIDAANAIIAGKNTNYDIGSFNGNPFIYVAAFGAFTDVSYDTPQLSKNLLGPAAYFLEGIKKLPAIKGINVKIKTIEGEQIEEDVFICLIMNSTSVAGIEVTDIYSDINTADGVFEIALIPKVERLSDAAALIAATKAGETAKNGIRIISTAGAEITTNEKVRWTLDGEFGGATDKVRFYVLHNAVNFIINEK